MATPDTRPCPGIAKNSISVNWRENVSVSLSFDSLAFGTHTGTVACAPDWDMPMRVCTIVPSRSDSFERLFHGAQISPCLLDLRKHPKSSTDTNAALRRLLSEPRLERFIGVIYRPETERLSHYPQAILANHFDAYVWFDETSAVEPLDWNAAMDPKEEDASVEETYPLGH